MGPGGVTSGVQTDLQRLVEIRVDSKQWANGARNGCAEGCERKESAHQPPRP